MHKYAYTKQFSNFMWDIYDFTEKCQNDYKNERPAVFGTPKGTIAFDPSGVVSSVDRLGVPIKIIKEGLNTIESQYEFYTKQFSSQLSVIWKSGYDSYDPDLDCGENNPYKPDSIEWHTFMEGWYAAKVDKNKKSSKQFSRGLTYFGWIEITHDEAYPKYYLNNVKYNEKTEIPSDKLEAAIYAIIMMGFVVKNRSGDKVFKNPADAIKFFDTTGGDLVIYEK